jgi:hypothetical protein
MKDIAIRNVSYPSISAFFHLMHLHVSARMQLYDIGGLNRDGHERLRFNHEVGIHNLSPLFMIIFAFGSDSERNLSLLILPHQGVGNPTRMHWVISSHF